MVDVSQGNSRRGSCGIYLNPLHDDFEELADQIIADDEGWNIGWNTTDEFETLFQRDPQHADEIWKRMFKAKMTKQTTGRNPKTGEIIEIPPRLKVVFKPSKVM